MVKWWDRFWGAVWVIGTLAAACLTARWVAENAAPAELGGLRYGLIVSAGLFGLLVSAFCLSAVILGLTTGSEWLLARLGHPLRRPALREADQEAKTVAAADDAEPSATAPGTGKLSPESD